MDYAALAAGLALPWLLGFSFLLAIGWPRAASGGRVALLLGYGYFVGALLLTVWMHALSAMEIRFGWIAIGAPIFAATAVFFALAAHRGRLRLAAAREALLALLDPPLLRPHLWVWWLLLAWLALRFALLAGEVAWQPLYPWDAWVQWATKARVWYELGRIAPFVGADAWLAGAPGAYFDASPDYPATIPLQQVWACIALGRWDDAAMNWPWLLTLLALTLGVYGSLRDAGLPQLGALVGAYLVASLPLVDVHVALAGYADLLTAAVYALGVLALYRWTLRRDLLDAGIALLLALACPLIQPIGLVWSLTLLPGVIVAVMPARGIRLVAAILGLAALVILALSQTETTLFGYRLHLDFQRPWQALVDSYLLFANWNLLWYGVVALALLGARKLVRAPLAPLAMVVVSGLAFVFFVSAYIDAVSRMIGFTTLNRATLQLAPLVVCLAVLLWWEMTAPSIAAERQASGAPALGSTAADA